jgi:hypothetical protein
MKITCINTCLSITAVMVQTFYEILDEVFETTIKDKENMSQDDYLDLKIAIIKGYEKSLNKRSSYISGLIKPKIFKISDDGSIQELKTSIQIKNAS